VSIWSRLIGREAKVSAAGGAIASYHVGRPVWTDRDFGKLADEGFVRNAIGYRCTKMIAKGGASVPWLLTRKGKAAIDEHPLLDLLSRPGPKGGGSALFEAFYAYGLLSGNKYLEAVGPDRKPPRELWTQRPDRMRVIPGAKALPQGYEYTANGQTVRWQADPITGQGPILHVKEFHPLNDWYGLSCIDPAAYGIDRHNAASAHNKALLDNGARPSGALIFKPVTVNGSAQSAPQTIIDAAELRLNDRHTGTANAGRPMVFGGDVAWEEMGFSPRDMDFGANKDDAARDICLSFGVPPMLVVKGESTFNNMSEAKLQLWEETILPMLDQVVDELNAWLAPMFGDDLRLSADLDEISALEPRRESKRKSIVELLDKGVIDEDEAREALQYGPRKPDAVKKVDAAVLGALVTAARNDPALFEALFRYMRSVGLTEPGATPEQLIAAAERIAAGGEDDQNAAATPPAPAAGTEEDATDADA
jgi:HK97 family phage portal protein